MPFVHEGSNGNVTITPTNHLSLNDLKHVIGSGVSVTATSAGSSTRQNPQQNLGSARLHRIVTRESVPSYNNVSSSGGNSQQRLAQRKLQMAKMMSNGGSANALAAAAMNNFRTNIQSHDNSRSNDPMFVSSRRARSNNFTLKETFDLLKVWASPEMQWQMKHNFRNFRVWEAISYSMSELGHDRTAIQCKNRIQNLTSIFYRIKKSKQDYRTFNFPYYKLIGDVLDGKKSGSSLGSLGLHAASVNAYGQGLNPADFANSNTSTMSVSPSSQGGSGSSAAGFAAHLALVEEYQHLINGQPEVYITPTGGRASSNHSGSGLNVLSPEVSLSEGNSPIRVESSSRPSSSGPQGASGRGSSRNGPASMLKMEMGDNGMKTDEDDIEQGDEEDEGSDLADHLGGDDEISDQMDSLPAARGKRAFSNSFGSYMKGNGGLPAKRPRGVSTASTMADGSTGGGDPIAQYLSEMVDIERQWLDMERERAENERSMMMYMMQILQALVSPGQTTEDEDNEEEEGLEEEAEENNADAEVNEDDASQIRQMIDRDDDEVRENGASEQSTKLPNGNASD